MIADTTAKMQRMQARNGTHSGASVAEVLASGRPGTVALSRLTEARRADWDAYVGAAAGGLPQHLSGWQAVLHKSYGYATHFLLAERQSRVVGVLPLFVVRSRLVGDTAMTLPGGLCADDDEAAAALIEHARDLARAERVKRLVLQDARRVWPGALHTESHHESWLVDVRGGEEALWSQLHRNIRRQVRMAKSNDLTVEIDRTGRCLDDFYALFSRFTHQSGTPVFGRAFVENVVEAFPSSFNIVVVRKGSQPIGAYFQLETATTMAGVWGAALHEFLELRPVYLAYWETLAHAVERGFAAVDMGRSPAGSNASKFKGQWNGVSCPVYQQTASLVPGAEADGSGAAISSVTSRVQSDAKFQTFRQIWPRLPYAVVQRVGPLLRRHVPFA